jgi:hypothetical protein
MIPPAWLFVVWGLDIPSLFPRAIGGFGYLYVTIDKFTRWPEANLVVKINKQSIAKFIKFCEDLGIKICYVSVAHLKSNGQVKRANAEILKGLKTRTYDCLKKHGAKWIDEFPCALWANRTSSCRATGEMPLFVVYEAEAVIPPISHHGLPPCPGI